MNVPRSTRAASRGSERGEGSFWGRFASFKRLIVPFANEKRQSRRSRWRVAPFDAALRQVGEPLDPGDELAVIGRHRGQRSVLSPSPVRPARGFRPGPPRFGDPARLRRVGSRRRHGGPRPPMHVGATDAAASPARRDQRDFILVGGHAGCKPADPTTVGARAPRRDRYVAQVGFYRETRSCSEARRTGHAGSLSITGAGSTSGGARGSSSSASAPDSTSTTTPPKWRSSWRSNRPWWRGATPSGVGACSTVEVDLIGP